MISNQPSVSIIMNCYNSDEFLREAIDSVYAQTYQNWEIVFWDNNSDDKSSEIAKSYNEKLKYFKADELSTLYKARNFALDKCEGDYIAFIDCDDVWVETKLAQQIELAVNGADIVYGGYNTIDTLGALKSEESQYLVSGKLTNSLFKRNSISIGCVLIKRSLLDGIYFDPYYDLLGDYDMWVRLSLRHQIVAVNGVVEYSRQHDNNISVTLNEKWLTERRYFYRKHLTFTNIFKYPWIMYYVFKTEVLGLIGRR